MIGCINEFRCALNWLLFPIVFIINILISIILNNILIFVLLIFSYFIYSLINYLITIKTINKLSDNNYSINIDGFVSYTVALLISNIGPIYSLIFRKKEKYKTER